MFSQSVLFSTLWLNIFIAPIALAGDGQPICFYLDKDKSGKQLTAVRLTSESTPLVELKDDGLFYGSNRLCQWSRNGGSGVREVFALDGDLAVPILDPGCEVPFSHIYTGVGFGDWYLTLCGTRTVDSLIIPFLGSEYSVELDSLKQWTEYQPRDFPFKGDKACGAYFRTTRPA